MPRGWHLLIFKVGVKGQGHMLDIVVKPSKHDTDWTISTWAIKLGTHNSYDKRMTPIDFKGHGSKVKVTRKTSLLNLVNRINPFYIAIYNVISFLNSPVGRILQRWRSSCCICRKKYLHLKYYEGSVFIQWWNECLFSGFMGNESERRTNKSREPRSGRAICLFLTPIHSPWTQKKHSFLIFTILPAKNLSILNSPRNFINSKFKQLRALNIVLFINHMHVWFAQPPEIVECGYRELEWKKNKQVSRKEIWYHCKYSDFEMAYSSKKQSLFIIIQCI